MTSGQDTAAARHCAAEVEAQDRDRYLTALFAPVETRPRLMALYAFNLELARIPELVSEPMIGEIRQQWWREAIAGIFEGTPRRHDVVETLAAAVRDADLPRAPFDRLIDARAADLEEAPFADLDALAAYTSATSGGLMELAARALTREPVPPSALTAAGTAWALSGILRAIAFHAMQGRVLLPRDLLQAENIDAHDLIQGRPTAALARVAAALHERAMHSLDILRRDRREVPKAAVPALLPAVLAESDLAALRAAKFDVFAPRLQQRRPGRIARLIWHGLRQRL